MGQRDEIEKEKSQTGEWERALNQPTLAGFEIR